MASAVCVNQDQIETLIEDDDEDENAKFISTSATPVSTTIQVMAKTKNDKEEKYTTSNIVYQHLTTAAHTCILLYTILIIYFCFSGNFEFFTWHPLLLSIGWMFLMSEAILALSKDNIIAGTLPKKVRVRLHWIFQAISFVLIGIGFAVVFTNKNYLNKEHFKSWHGLFGFIAIICNIPTVLNGIVALYHGDLRHYIHPKYSKFIHIFNGTVVYSFGGLALILSVYTKWFARHSNDNVLIFLLGLMFVVFAVGWTLLKPTVSSLNRLKSFLSD